MKKVKDYSFRDLRGKICFIKNNENIQKMKFNEYLKGSEKANGVLCYGYIDYNAGFTFEVLCLARIDEDENITPFEGNKNTTLKLRCDEVDEAKMLIVNDEQIAETHSSKISGINEYYVATRAIEKIRGFTFLDSSRHKYFPDDVFVLLHKKGEIIVKEGVWVRCKAIREDGFAGTLINETHQELGLHKGDEILFKATTYDADGNIKDDKDVICFINL